MSEIIEIKEYLKREANDCQIVAFDKYGQAFIPLGFVEINGKIYDAKNFNFNTEEFLKGKEETLLSGRKMMVLPREIKSVMEIPNKKEILKEQTK